MPSSIGKTLLETTSFRLLGQVLSWASTIVVMRLLVPADYAVVAMTTAVFGIAMTLVDWSITPILVRKKAISTEDEQAVFNYSFCLAALIAVVLLLLSTFSDELFLKGTRQAFWVQAIAVLIIPLRIIPEARMARTQDFRTQNIAIFLEVLTIAATSFTLALILRNYLAISFGMAAGVIVRALFSSYKAGLALPKSITPVALLGVFKQTRLIAGADILQQLSAAIPTYIMGVFLGGHALGLVSTALHLVALPSARLMNVLNQVYLPVLANVLHKDKEEFKTMTLLAITGVLWLSMPAFVGLALVAEPFTATVLGKNWSELPWILALLSLSMPLKILRDFIMNPLRASSLDKEIASNQFGLAFLQISASLVAISANVQYTVIALAIATVVISIGTIYRGIRALQLSLRAVGLATLRPAVACLIMAGAATATTHFTSSSPAAFQLVAIILSSITTYCIAALAIMSAEIRQQIFLRFRKRI